MTPLLLAALIATTPVCDAADRVAAVECESGLTICVAKLDECRANNEANLRVIAAGDRVVEASRPVVVEKIPLEAWVGFGVAVVVAVSAGVAIGYVVGRAQQ